MRLFTLGIVLLFLSGCTEFPELDAAMSARAQGAAYPALLPLDDLIASVPPVAPGLGIGNLPDQVSRLQARAAALRGRAVVDAGTRARMNAALARHL